MAIPVINQITPQTVKAADPISILGLNLDGVFDLYYGPLGPISTTNSNPEKLITQVPDIPLGVYSVRLETPEGSSNTFDIFITDSVADSVEICPTIYSEEDYENAQLGLLPRGLLWLFPETANWRKLFGGLAVEIVRLQTRACDLITESFPLLTTELINEWETDLALPDKCSPPNVNDLNSRRSQILRKLTQRGGQSIAYYTELARTLGFDIDIIELTSNPFEVGKSTVGEALDNTGPFTWVVRANDFEIINFEVGVNTVGQPLRQWFNTELECLFNEIKPAHTIVIFQYLDPESLDTLNENGAAAGDIINENGAATGDIINENPF